MALKGDIVDFLEREHIGHIHSLLLFLANKANFTALELPPEFSQAMPELKRLGELVLRDIEEIMRSPSQTDFRKGRLPGEKKPLSKEKQLAAFLLATKEKRESLRAVACLWNYLLFMTQGSLPKKKLKSFLIDFLLARRSKLLRKWRSEIRFRKLMEKFERSYTESLVGEMVSVISEAPTRPLLESARAIYTIGRVIAPMEKRVHQAFIDQFLKRYETTCKDDQQAAEALGMAVMYVLKPFRKPLTHKWWSDLLRREVDVSFTIQRDAVKALVVERNKKRRAAAASSLHGLMMMRQIVLMDSFGLIDHAAYGKEVTKKWKEVIRRERKKVKRKR